LTPSKSEEGTVDPNELDDVVEEKPKVPTTCSECGRSVYSTDVDAAGRCILCTAGKGGGK
jgi:hypothetical protein